MVKIFFDSSFKKTFSKTDKGLQVKILRQLEKVKNNPKVGKPTKYCRKGTRELYIPPFRLSNMYEDDNIIILDLYHKDKQS